MSPEPVTSTEIESSLLSRRMETCAFELVTPATVLRVRPRQSKDIDSTVSKVMPEGREIVRVSLPPSPSRSIVTS
jgi:hypothetical protein